MESMWTPRPLPHPSQSRQQPWRAEEAVCSGCAETPGIGTGVCEQKPRVRWGFLLPLGGCCGNGRPGSPGSCPPCRAGQRQPRGALPGSGDGRVPCLWGSEPGQGWRMGTGCTPVPTGLSTATCSVSPLPQGTAAAQAKYTPAQWPLPTVAATTAHTRRQARPWQHGSPAPPLRPPAEPTPPPLTPSAPRGSWVPSRGWS